MNQRQAKIDAFQALMPLHFSLVMRFELTQVPLVEGFDLHLAMDLDSDEEELREKRLVLRFESLRTIELSQPAGAFYRWVVISDISDRQWEGINYQVTDFEHQTFSFFCRDFEASIVAR
jgi:aspartate/methionine/tyrosine aminotransferase